jgi:hypothetical protein
VAGAIDWPGLDRSASSEDAAIEKLLSYVARYEPVAHRAGMSAKLRRQKSVEVIERVPGSSSTDFWGIAHVPSEIERQVLSPRELERRLDLLRACWAHFDAVSGRVSAELRPGQRGGGRDRDRIVRHVTASEWQWSRKVGIPAPKEVAPNPEELARHRREYPEAIRAYNAEGKPARSWPIQFLIRRSGYHVMDHTWEMEDRDLS